MKCQRLVYAVVWLCFTGIFTFALTVGISINDTASAHDDVHGRPHFKGSPANPTAVMKRLQADAHSAQSLASVSDAPCIGGMADTYPCHNIDLLAFLPLVDIGGSKANDIWGWTDSLSGREFAIIGLYEGTAFIEITDPVNPIYLGNLASHGSGSTWRDIKTSANYAFIVSEASGHGMQVFDLRKLLTASPNTTFSEDTQYNAFGNAHNIVINESTGFAYAVGTGTCAGGLHMVNIQNPLLPTYAGCYGDDGYTHDAQCVVYGGPDSNYTGREICFNSNEDTLTIVDVTAKSSPVQLSRTNYPGGAYTHQGWLTPDHQYFLLDDELDEQSFRHNTRTRVFDVSNLSQPILVGNFDNTTAAIDHNQYVKGNHAFQANYRAGLRILDITNLNTAAFQEVAYFDIYPSNDSANFNGAWSTYPYFPSGNVVVSGIEQGLFVLRPNLSGSPPPAGNPPDAPSGIAAADQQDGTALITFADNSNNELGFELQREKRKGNGWRSTIIINLGSNVVSYTDASGAGVFRYSVRAVNQFGNSSWTEWVEITVTDNDGGANTKCHPRKGCAP